MSRIQPPEDVLNVDTEMGAEEEIVDSTAVPTDDEVVDADDAAIRDAVVGATGVNDQPKKLKRVTLPDGRVFTGETERAILEQIAADTGGAGSREVRVARDKMAYVRDREEAKKPWDPQKYLDLLGTDPMEARRYQDRHYLGLSDDEDPAEAIRFAYTVADKVVDSIEVSEFLRTTQASLTEADATLVLEQLERENLAMTARNLRSVYDDLVRERYIVPRAPEKPGRVEYEDITPQNPTGRRVQQQEQSRGRGGPRALGGGSARTVVKGEKDPEAMSLQELEASLRAKGALD